MIMHLIPQDEPGLPEIDGEFHLMVSDWMHLPSEKIFEMVQREAVRYCIIGYS